MFSSPKVLDRLRSPPGVQFSGYQGSLRTQKTQKISASANKVHFFQLSTIKSRLAQIKDKLGIYPPLPRYSAALSPPDYFLFPKLKMTLKGLHFADVAEIQVAVTDELKKVQKEEFSAAFQKVYDRAKACVYANGAYFEY